MSNLPDNKNMFIWCTLFDQDKRYLNTTIAMHVSQDQDNETFKDLLKANIDKHMQMTIYSSKTQQLRGLFNQLIKKSGDHIDIIKTE